MSTPASLAYCVDQIRRHDHDRYLTSLFLPAGKREAVQALFAFNLEIARTRESVSEPMLGQIRLQWWREAVDEIYQGKQREHPVGQAMAAAIRTHHLSADKFARLIDSREFDLTDTPSQTLADLEEYAADSSGALLELVMEILDQHGRASPLAAARHVGLAWALIGLIRALPYHIRVKRLYLPAAMLDAAQVDRRLLFATATAPGLAKVVEQLVVAAETHLSGARLIRRDIAKQARPGLLIAILATVYIRAIRRVAYEPRNLARLRVPPAARLLFATLRQHY